MSEHLKNQQLGTIVKSAETAIESGEIGRAAGLFEEGCQVCEINDIDPKDEFGLMRIAAGIFLLQECEKEPENPQENQDNEAAADALQNIKGIFD